MTSDVRKGALFVVAMSALSLPRHDGDSAPVDGNGRARPALDFQEIGGRGHRDPPLLDPGGAAVAHDLALDELRAGTGAEVRVRSVTVSLTGSAGATAAAARPRRLIRAPPRPGSPARRIRFATASP